MENASKALIISGGILISMLVISIGVYLFASYSDVGSSYEQSMAATEIQKFNVNFTKFEGRDDITIHEIITLVEFTKQYKEQTEIDIPVTIGSDELKDNDIIELIKENSTKETATGDEEIKHFKCKEILYNEDGKVESIKFI